MTHLGLLKQFLGLEIEKYNESIKIIQSKYVADLLLKFNMAEFKESNFPLFLGVKLCELVHLCW